MANITRRFLPALDEAHNAHLVAVATKRPAVAAQVAANRPGVHLHTTYEALLVDPDVEAIYLPLPNTLHAEWAVKAMAAGKHVLCEKPMATTQADAEAMAAAAGRYGRHLMEAFMWRFHPQHAAVRERIAAGAIGTPRLVRAGLSFNIDTSKPNIRLDRGLGGGVIWDVGCYAMSIPRFLFEAEPRSVQARARIDANTGVDMTLSALVDFGGGRTAVLDASMEQARRTSYEVIGTTGIIRIKSFWIEPDAEAEITIIDSSGSEMVERLAPFNHFTAEIEHFSATVRGDTSLRYGPQDALHQIRALTAMQRSFGSGRAEAVAGDEGIRR